MAVNQEPAWRNTPMSATANADPTADGIAWHAVAVDDVVKRLATDIGKGLEANEAAKRLQKYGPNRLPEGKKRGPFMRFLSQFNNILVYVLLGAGFTKLMLNLWVDAAIIFGVVILNALLGLLSGGQSREGAGVHPQHAIRGGADATRRRDAHDSRGAARAGGHRAS